MKNLSIKTLALLSYMMTLDKLHSSYLWGIVQVLTRIGCRLKPQRWSCTLLNENTEHQQSWVADTAVVAHCLKPPVDH